MSNSNQDNDHWWGIGISLFFFLGAVIVYKLIGFAEASGQILRMRGLAALAYTIGGKWLVPLLLVAMGVYSLVETIQQWRRRR
jgi:hypothetical protein